MSTAVEKIRTELIEEDGQSLVVDYDVLFPFDNTSDTILKYQREIYDIDKELQLLVEKESQLNSQIDDLSSHADNLDYIVAVASGVLCGLVDAIFVGKLDIESAMEKSEKRVADAVKDRALHEKIRDTVTKAKENAKKKGKKLTEEDIKEIEERVKNKFYSDPNNISEQGQDPVLRRAIRYLEKKHPAVQDNLFWGTGSRPESHHLDDLAHHPTVTGLIASIVAQFFRVATFVNNEGKWSVKFVPTNPKELFDIWLPIIMAGLFNWLVFVADKATNEGKLDTDIPKPIFKLAHLLASAPAVIQVLKTADNWCLHLYSDVAGSQSSKGRGAGIPGLFVSFLKELSCIPPLNKTNLPQIADHLYTDLQLDFRKELGIVTELGKETIPVVINDVLIRSFYFVRRLVIEYKEHNGWKNVSWTNVVPFNNHTIARMITIASGTFILMDMADAAVRSAIESGGFLPKFAEGFVVRVNFIGIGRFAVAVGYDIHLGTKQSRLRNERMQIMAQQLSLQNVKLFYKNAEVFLKVGEVSEAQKQMWISAQNTVEELSKIYQSAQEAYICYFKNMSETFETFEKCAQNAPEFCKNNPEIGADAKSILKFGGYKKYGKQ